MWLFVFFTYKKFYIRDSVFLTSAFDFFYEKWNILKAQFCTMIKIFSHTHLTQLICRLRACGGGWISAVPAWRQRDWGRARRYCVCVCACARVHVCVCRCCSPRCSAVQSAAVLMGWTRSVFVCSPVSSVWDVRRAVLVFHFFEILHRKQSADKKKKSCSLFNTMAHIHSVVSARSNSRGCTVQRFKGGSCSPIIYITSSVQEAWFYIDIHLCKTKLLVLYKLCSCASGVAGRDFLLVKVRLLPSGPFKVSS